MYKICDATTGDLIAEVVSPKWVKQQFGVDFPILCDNEREADGVVLPDDETMLGIQGRDMYNYTPNVVLEKVNSDPYLFEEIDNLKKQNAELKKENEELKSKQLDIMQGLADIYVLQLGGIQ